MIDARGRRPLFLDIEASGFRGWPIEIAWAEWVDGTLLVESHLIRPDPTWHDALWDEAAEAVHGIERAFLEQAGLPAREVADLALLALRDRLLVSDAAEFDTDWLRQLLDLQPVWGDVQVTDIAQLQWMLEPTVRERLSVLLSEDCPAHRAGEDATRLANAWRAAGGW